MIAASARQQAADVPQTERERLLGLAVDYVLSNGVASLTLRGLATAIGSNNRMLLYYFGSKDQLTMDALDAAASRFPRFRSISQHLRSSPADLETRLSEAWDGISAAETRPFARLFFEVFGLAVNRPDSYGAWLEQVAHGLVDDVTATLEREGMRRASAEVLARELVGCWRGLQMDLLSSSDERRAHLAAQAAVSSVCARVGRD
ncbi:TetR/AcrR family transcriptional regulator [Actinospica sp.]|uniref:TetR/AcrR family transcriptional regulator n=1 Tax=Actinospica sp. TaxID=1872142 RepID=UPI002C5E7DAC|nr:TetR/AcrR family transcriptional regulator [Actinospica sp.]HWG26323.1 TetR/AcrR family transcriptional regulator [Actinospica sp.]